MNLRYSSSLNSRNPIGLDIATLAVGVAEERKQILTEASSRLLDNSTDKALSDYFKPMSRTNLSTGCLIHSPHTSQPRIPLRDSSLLSGFRRFLLLSASHASGSLSAQNQSRPSGWSPDTDELGEAAQQSMATVLDSGNQGSARPNPNVDPITMLRLPNLLMSRPAAGMARTEPIAAIINDLPKTAGERWRCA
jgi:hypothetical protein